MPKEALGVWSPHRDSKSVLAFKSMLGMRAERWLWLNEPDQASWWVVDGTRDNLSELTVNLHREKAQGPVRGVLLAPDWSAVKDPVWVFFKVPLQVNQVYRWIDACCPQPSAPVSAEALFAEQHIQLLRWPNMTRYNANATVAQGIELTVACARLLSAPMTYEEVRSLLPTEANRTQLDVVLKDALQNGMLGLTPIHQPAAAPTRAPTPAPAIAPTPVPASPAVGTTTTARAPAAVAPPVSRPAVPSPSATSRTEERGAWSLIKRLILKFT